VLLAGKPRITILEIIYNAELGLKFKILIPFIVSTKGTTASQLPLYKTIAIFRGVGIKDKRYL